MSCSKSEVRAQDCNFGTYSTHPAAELCTPCGELETTLKVRVTDNSSCVCANGAYRSQDHGDECVVCGDGLLAFN